MNNKVMISLLIHTLVILALVWVFDPVVGLAIYGAWHLCMHVFYTIRIIIWNNNIGDRL